MKTIAEMKKEKIEALKGRLKESFPNEPTKVEMILEWYSLGFDAGEGAQMQHYLDFANETA